MHVPFINIHTHNTFECTEREFSIPNIIISKNYLVQAPCSLGIHPWYVDSNPSAQIDVLDEYGKRENVIAIGECGLDKLCDTEWQLQQEIFEKQITFANLVQKPLIVHCVKAHQECLELLKKNKTTVPVIFHGFEKNINLAQQIIKAGYYLSFGPTLLNGKKDALITDLPLDKIFLETDDRSIKIIDVYAYFCAIREIEVPELKDLLYRNFKNIFKHQLLK